MFWVEFGQSMQPLRVTFFRVTLYVLLRWTVNSTDVTMTSEKVVRRKQFGMDKRLLLATIRSVGIWSLKHILSCFTHFGWTNNLRGPSLFVLGYHWLPPAKHFTCTCFYNKTRRQRHEVSLETLLLVRDRRNGLSLFDPVFRFQNELALCPNYLVEVIQGERDPSSRTIWWE